MEASCYGPERERGKLTSLALGCHRERRSKDPRQLAMVRGVEDFPAGSESKLVLEE